MSSSPKKKRKRGVVLSAVGLTKLKQAIQDAEGRELDSGHYTFEALSNRLRLDPKTIAKVLDGTIGLDKGSLERCFQGFQLTLTPKDYQYPEPSPPEYAASCQTDWGDAVDTSVFFGREAVLTTLRDWLITDRCRLIAVLGMGGVGKTTLSVKLAKQLSTLNQPHFDWIIWRSLRHGPTLHGLLFDLLTVLTQGTQQLSRMTTPMLSSTVLGMLKQHRCLLILDNWETVLSSGSGQSHAIAGLTEPTLSGYGDFLQQIGEVEHQSSLVITSREKPAEVAMLEGVALPVRAMLLPGLESSATRELLQAKGLVLNPSDSDRLCAQYDGSPLGLKMIATTITDLFAGDIQAFLAEDVAIFNGLRMLLNQQFDRLSENEQEVLYWLAISRDPLSTQRLADLILGGRSSIQLLESIESLQRRSICVTVPGMPTEFTLQPVVMDYTTKRFVEMITAELAAPPALQNALNRFALSLTTVKERIRLAQIRFILQPVLDLLLKQWESASTVITQLQQRLQQLRQDFPRQPGYQAGNILNLLQLLQADLRGQDFSQLCIWHVDFQTRSLANTRLTNSHLKATQFAKTFLAITDIAIAQDRHTFVTAHFEGQILHWNWQGQLLNGFQANHSNVWSVALHPDGERLVSTGDDGCLRFWHLPTGQLQQTFQVNPNALYQVIFDPSGDCIYGSGNDGFVEVWEPRSGYLLHQWQAHDQRIWSLAISPSGTYLATASDDTTIKIWNLATQTCTWTLRGHRDWIRAIAFSPTQSILASGGCDQTIRLWDLHKGKALQSIEHPHSAVFRLTFSPTGKQLISGSGDGTITVFDVATGQTQRTFEGHRSSVYAMAVEPASNRLVSGGDDATLRIWDIPSGQSLMAINTHVDGVSAMVFIPEDGYIAMSCMDGAIRLLNISTWTHQTYWGHQDRIYDIALSSDGKTLATGSADHSVGIWDTRGTLKQVWQHHQAPAPSISFHPTRPLIASGSWDGEIQIRTLDSGQLVQSFQDHFIQSLRFSPDGKWLAVGSFDAEVKLWDWEAGRCNRILVGHGQWAWFVTFSPDGQWLASASADGTCRLWCVATGACAQVFVGHTDWIMMPAFSPDSRQLLTASKDQSIRCWSVDTGDCLAVLTDHHAWVGSVLFSPDGTSFFSGSTALTIKQWDAQTYRCIKTWQGDRLYGQLDITETSGISARQKQMMQELGAVV